MIRFSAAILPVVFSLAAYAQTAPLTSILKEELHRNFGILKQKADPPPYFISYAVTEQEGAAISATLGALKTSESSLARFLDVSVRVGSPELDNYHRMPGESAHFTSGAPLPIEDQPGAIRQRLWRETDRSYRLAAERLIKIRASRQVKVTEEDNSGDFSEAESAVYSEPVSKLRFNNAEWSDRVRKWSAEFANNPAILTSSVSVMAQSETKYFVNTEGTQLQHGRSYARLVITARGKAHDGMDLTTAETFEAEDPGKLPGDKEVRAAIERVSRDLAALLRAPVVEPFAGPAVLSGRATAVFFHEIFGHRVEGHRQKDQTDGQTFTKSVGSGILPEFLSVVFDPTRREFNGTGLNGWYRFDDEGVKAERVAVVEKGVLKNFLMSRSPVRGFPQSNGHGRRQPGLEVVSRQSNMFVESDRKVSEPRLRAMLIEEIKRQQKPYGLYFRQVTGGFTTTGRAGIQAFKVIPILVYRVYPDGRPDELVRGADIVGTPLTSFGRIAATSDRFEIFNGYCGAESGNVPVAAVAPAVLVTEIEIQKQQVSQDRPPLLPSPALEGRR